MILLAPAAARAEGPVDKLGRGLTNVITCPGEYFVQFYVNNEQHNNPFETIFGTLVKGTFATVLRAGAGIYDIVTFPVPLPRDYAPILRPDNIFTAFDQVDGE